jgi:Mg-chelatase subunit ChlD
MSLVMPQVLLLLVPLGLFVWRQGWVRGLAGWLRVAVMLLLTFALAGPELHLKRAGSDVVVVVDRSRSMPPMSEASAEELIRLLEPQRRPGDRLGVLSFGRDARVDAPLSPDGRFGGFTTVVDGDASNLASALGSADALIPPERTGRVLVLSDGRPTGLDARVAARRLWARGVPVDVRFMGRATDVLDVAVIGLDVPPVVATREPFLMTASVRATAEAEATFELFRGGAPIARVSRHVPPGTTTLTFRDVVEAPGLQGYELRVSAPGDGVPGNDVGRAVVRVQGPPRVLLLTDQPTGTLAKALTQAGLELEVEAPMAVTMERLDGVAAVVLENVEAGRLSERGLSVLAQYVREAGGGLVMTGGRHAFGEGGYRKSPVEELLPVSLEIREEQRKAAIAIAIVMDSSCSMGARVPDGRTKMELAAEGVVGALQLLNPRDEASVHMVDTGAHEIFPMSPVSDGLPLDRVARGFSGGGGIYIDVGLKTGERQILTSDKATRHVLLFADASDSEEPGDYQRTVENLVSKNVTVSVIGMGRPTDSDAELLRDVAARGRGRIYFADDVTSLPRIFSLETIAVARSTFVDATTPTRFGPDLAQLGRLTEPTAPVIGGYNLAYPRPNASLAVLTDDAAAAPIVALWPRGAGRVAAVMAEVDGPSTGEWRRWPGQRALLEQVVRWVTPVDRQRVDAVARARLDGSDLHVTLDFDPSGPPVAGTPSVVLLSGDAHVPPVELPMMWEEEDRVGVHWVLPGTGTWYPVVRHSGALDRLAPVTLPWSPELEPAPAEEGRARLAAIARAGGGVERIAMAGLFQEAPESEAGVPLASWLVAAAVALVTMEVLARRFFASPRKKPRWVGATAPAGAPTATGPSLPVIPPAPGASSSVEGGSPEAPAPSTARGGVRAALAAARERAGRRTKR